MKNTLRMVLFSRRLLTDAVARQQIAALSDFHGGLMRPDKWSVVEPIRTPFNPSDLNAPIQGLVKPHGEFFYRKGSPVYLSGEIWNLTRPTTARFPGPLFSNYWTGRFDGKWAERVGLQKVQDFVSEMFRVSGSDFGLLTTEIDQKAKNSVASSFSYQGLNLDSGIPGLYWMNLFSDGFAEWLGVRGFPKELAMSAELAGGGVSLKFCELPEQCRDIETLQRQRTTIEWLGPEKFFDIRHPDRKLDAPDWNQLPTQR